MNVKKRVEGYYIDYETERLIVSKAHQAELNKSELIRVLAYIPVDIINKYKHHVQQQSSVQSVRAPKRVPKAQSAAEA